MELFQSLSGMTDVQLTGGDLHASLRSIQRAGIDIRNVQPIDSLTISFRIHRRDMKALRSICDRRGDELKRIGIRGVYWRIRGLLKRPFLILGGALILSLSLYLPGRILFVRVEGNTYVPTNQILEEAAACGISFGISARHVRSEHVKNQLLARVRDLQWVGVNTRGCVAVISVRERTVPQQEDAYAKVSSIVARRDGMVISVVTERGSAMCRPGDAVTKGQVLISGYSDHGIKLTAEQARGEVIALTEHELTVICPTMYEHRRQVLSTERRFFLLLGKKQINLSKCSGILDATCARIYSQWYVTLPGGYALPIGVACEELITYAQDACTDPPMDLTGFAADYVLSHSEAGEIVTVVSSAEEESGLVVFHGHFTCRENLGITRIEEKFENYGKDP